MSASIIANFYLKRIFKIDFRTKKYFDLNQLEDDLDDSQLLNNKQRHVLWLKYEQNESNYAIANKLDMNIEDCNNEIETILLILHCISPNYREKNQTFSISKTTYFRM